MIHEQQQSPPVFARIPETETVAAAIDLNGTWQFKATDEDEWLLAVVPGVVHSDLLRAGRIPDPYYRDNEFKVQWVERKDWEYRRIFPVDEDFLAHDRIVLDCRGLDTIAEVYLNGSLLAETRNMFVEYEFAVKELLRRGENELRIIFRSIVTWNERQKELIPRITWDDIKGDYFFARKCGADFGWDWGIRLVGCGIWRPIRLAAYDGGRIADFAVRQDLRDPRLAVLNVIAEVRTLAARRLSLTVQVAYEGQEVARVTAPVTDPVVTARLQVENPKLWWPNGQGDQSLYTVLATLADEMGTVVHWRRVRIGLRTVELVQDKDACGQMFGFKINGHLIFCKGGNWIPADAMQGQLTEGHYRHLLSSLRETNLNMVRPWGGGRYEPEYFYDLCDEYGLMIWHDFMFAVGPYLAEEGFLANVREEIANVVRRLRHHPSIVLWCGNNEIESSMPKKLQESPAVSWDDLDKVFYETIPQAAALHDPERPYWPCSPHHPLDRAKERPDYRTASGDAHVWEVWHRERPFDWYEENLDFRFVSEYGLQSLPAMETIASFTVPADRFFPSRILDLHNKAGKKTLGTENMGNSRIAVYAASMFKVPRDLDEWVYVTQVMHGLAMKVGAEAYRRNFPGTTGALYWQINDNWPTISGSGMDYYGRWKAMQYMARHFFHPVLVSGRVVGARAMIWGVNDLLREVPATLVWVLARFDGSEVKRGEQAVTLPANCSTTLLRLDLTPEVGENPEHDTYRNTNYESRSRFYLSYRLVQGSRTISTNVSFFAPPKYLALEDPALSCVVVRDADRPAFVLSAKRFAAFVELGLGGRYARFSDNYFHLLPGEKRRVELVETEPPVEEAMGRSRARSLFDVLRADDDAVEMGLRTTPASD